MALCVLQSGKAMTLKPEQALVVWDVLQGRREPGNEKLNNLCSQVKRLYLNRHSAPQDYLAMYPQPENAKKQDEQQLMWWQK